MYTLYIISVTTLSVHIISFILVINQLNAQNFVSQ